MSAAASGPWPFEWPPAPGSSMALWLPRLHEAAIEAMAQNVSDEGLTAELRGRTLKVSGRTAVVVIEDARPYRGGTVVTVRLRRRRWLPDPITFEDLRYPIAAVLGTLFVVSLGFGPSVPSNIYQGCVALMVGATSLIFAMSAAGYLLDARDNARRTSVRCVHGLGCALAELGARPVPATDSPFRR